MSAVTGGPGSSRPPRKITTSIEIPLRTIITVVLTIAALWLLWRLWQQLLLFFVALLVAAALDPVVARLEQRGWPRGRAVALLVAAFFGVIGLLAVLIVPPLIQQAARLAVSLPGYVARLQGLLDLYPELQSWLQSEAIQSSADVGAVAGRVVSVSTGLFSVIGNLLILITLTVYLMLDGPRLFEWLIHDLPASRRARARRIRRDVSSVVGAYVRGQTTVSLLFATFSYVTLTLAGTPEPLLLAVLAAFLDVVPMVGATLATIPAVLLSLTVSLPTALVVLVLYVVYQQVENYAIVPRVYHGALHLPSLAVLIALIVGGSLLGIPGALLSLPVAAAIPAAARAWREGDEPGSINTAPDEAGLDADKTEARAPTQRG